MKNLSVLLIAISALLSGCVAYPVAYRDGGGHRPDYDQSGPPNRGDHDRGDYDRGDHDRGKHDRDGDGVKDKKDRRPDDPYRY
ncbi:MAG: hypothetical protein IPP03_02945 [Dechloromonas sp.]|nr:hypothetical protein [Candidatus Dechloromonas phosphoritropha]